MPTFLAGGTGTPKLLWGADDVYGPESITVVANTGDDIVIGGLLVCPDLDSVLYERSDLLDRSTWWGIENDPARTHDQIDDLAASMGRGPEPQYLPPHAQTEGRDIARWRRFSAVPEFLHLGDRDRAIHTVRTSLIDEGKSLTAATKSLAEAFDLSIDLLPMSDDPVASIVQTPTGAMHFQAYWVGYEGDPEVSGVRFRGEKAAAPTEQTLEALADPVIIGPSNPITSIGPMLALDGITSALKATKVVAVSPFIEDTVFSGPAAELMEAEGYEASTAGVADAYDFADAFVLDEQDETPLDRPVVRTDTKIETRTDATRVARATKDALEMI